MSDHLLTTRGWSTGRSPSTTTGSPSPAPLNPSSARSTA